MRSGLSQAQEQALMRPAQEGMMPVTAEATAKEIPYDYVAKFTLQGRRGNRVQDVINISTEGAFVAVAIGYSFIPARLDRLIPPGKDGVPVVVSTFFQFQTFTPIDIAVLQCLLVKLCGIDFKYSIIASGTGRELQNQPIHNIAGLGESSGDRPFRPLAKPVLFMPRSTIRIEIEEISQGLPNIIGLPIYGYDAVDPVERIGSELFIVLHGYKILGYGTALP
ncbi:MAG: hypothetical protein ACREXR_12315 [Gammaproteobacteria bacterium]